MENLRWDVYEEIKKQAGLAHTEYIRWLKAADANNDDVQGLLIVRESEVRTPSIANSLLAQLENASPRLRS
jgi:hypothetical protein